MIIGINKVSNLPEFFTINKDVVLANGPAALSSVVNTDASIKFFSKASKFESVS